MNLKGKTAVITGATGGLGTLLVKYLAKEEVECILVDKDIPDIELLKNFSEDNQPIFIRSDFSDASEIDLLIKEINSNSKNIDILFNLAGIGLYKKIENISQKDWNDSISVNLTAPFLLIQGLLDKLKMSHGLVLNFGSGMGVVPRAGRTAYCASKFGLRGMSLSLSKELQPEGVDVVLLTLGSIMTNFGTGGLALRRELECKGKNYLDPDSVISEIIKICKSPNHLPEYVIYPEGYEEV